MGESLREALRSGVVVADGAMGTMLQAQDPSMEDFQGHEGCNEILNVTRPDVVAAVHDAYFAVGVDCVETNTFGANYANLAEYDITDRIFELAKAGAQIARECADKWSTPEQPRWVLGSMGPGTKLPSLGHAPYALLRDAYETQALGLIEGGVDAFLVETAQDLLQAKAAIKDLRYGQGDYFWIQDLQGQMLMHPIQPKLDGQNMSGNRDPDGKLFFQEMVDVAKRQGAGFVSYQWPKPGSDSPQPKISYVKSLPGWGWIIGSGVYVDSVNATLAQRTAGMAAGGLVLMAAVLALGLLITRSILRQLGGEPDYAADITRRIAAGDLRASIDIKYPGQENLLTALQTMRDQLAAVVSQVRQRSESLASASAQIAQGNLDLSGRTENQASALEETSASMEQLGSTVRQNSDNARQANQLAQSASEIAIRGGEVVAQVVDTMKGINDSSRRIADIIGVIDGIAFQTNILALNAAVEAARAGDQGRGFAVVAGEVRNLAQRSAQAAKEIKGLITTSVEKVQSGSLLVKDAGDTMGEIVASVQRVTDIIGEITAAAVEQSEGIAQVNVTVSQLDQMTQQNAALVEQSTAAAESLRDQAHRLIEVVSVFRVSGQANVTATPARPAPAPRPTPAVGALPPPAPHAQVTAPKLATRPATTGDSKKIANSTGSKSAGALNSSNSSAAQSASQSLGALKRPAPARAQVGAAKSAGSTAIAKPADDSGDWETF